MLPLGQPQGTPPEPLRAFSRRLPQVARNVWDVNCFILELVLDCHPEVTISSPVRRRCRQPLLMGCLGQFHVQASPVPTMGTPPPRPQSGSLLASMTFTLSPASHQQLDPCGSPVGCVT